MSRKYLLACGMLAALIYLGTVILGGLLRPGYSHVAHAISELIAGEAELLEALSRADQERLSALLRKLSLDFD